MEHRTCRARWRHERTAARLPLVALALVSLAWAGRAESGPTQGSAGAAATPLGRRAQLVVSLSGAAVPGSEGLGYFIPEVTRALAEGLERGGITVLPQGVSAAMATAGFADAPLAINVVLEERAGDRALLSARVRGRRADIDGPVEGMDALVDELANRILPLCFDGPVPQAPAVRTSTPRSSRGKDVVSSVKESPAPTGSPPPTKPTLVASTSPPPAPPMNTPVAPPVEPAAIAPAPTPAAPPPVLPAPTPPVAAAPPAKPHSEVIDPYGPDARVSDSAPVPIVDRGATGFVRGRVVVHTLVDPAGSDPGTGSIATQALYAFLQRRLRMSVVPMGTGVSSLVVAADEGQRAQARAVVMARLDGYSLSAAADGPIARMRLELSVVREGRLVMRRMLLAETQPGAITAAAGEGRRGRQIDPAYLAVSHALDGQLGELALALGQSGAAQ